MLSNHNFADQLEENTAVYAPITFEEILIVMVNRVFLQYFTESNFRTVITGCFIEGDH